MRLTHPRGFAYLWLLFTVAFLGLGLVIAAEVNSVAVQRDKEAELLSIGHQFREALRRYNARQAGPGQRYPATLDELLQDPRTPGVTRHLRQVFVDPMTGRAEWGLLRVGGRIVGVHSLSEAEPIKQAGFDDDDQLFAQSKRYRDWVFTHPPTLLQTSPEAQRAAQGQGQGQGQDSPFLSGGAASAPASPGLPGQVTPPTPPATGLTGTPGAPASSPLRGILGNTP